jgi:hypothetical protein
MPDVLAHNPAPRAAKDVADEKNVQVQLLASQPLAFSDASASSARVPHLRRFALCESVKVG